MGTSFTFIIAVVVALFMGLNIGGIMLLHQWGQHTGQKSGQKYQAVILIGNIFGSLGAVISGGEVIKPLNRHSSGGTIVLKGAIIAVAASGVTVFLANLIRVPISTSQAGSRICGWYRFFLWGLKINAPFIGILLAGGSSVPYWPGCSHI